jgi:hypothetical protein
VNIRVQGGKTYAVTDINGIYTIEVHANDVLRFTQPVIDTMVINRSMEQNRIYAHFPASAQQRMQDTVLVLRGGGHPTSSLTARQLLRPYHLSIYHRCLAPGASGRQVAIPLSLQGRNQPTASDPW